MSERPPDDASATEIMEWMEDSHSEAIAEAASEMDVDVSAPESDE